MLLLIFLYFIFLKKKKHDEKDEEATTEMRTIRVRSRSHATTTSAVIVGRAASRVVDVGLVVVRQIQADAAGKLGVIVLQAVVQHVDRDVFAAHAAGPHGLDVDVVASRARAVLASVLQVELVGEGGGVVGDGELAAAGSHLDARAYGGVDARAEDANGLVCAGGQGGGAGGIIVDGDLKRGKTSRVGMTRKRSR